MRGQSKEGQCGVISGNKPFDHPDYLLDSSEDCLAAQKAVNLPNARMLFDVYHMQTMGGNIVAFLRQNRTGSAIFTSRGARIGTNPRRAGSTRPSSCGRLIA